MKKIIKIITTLSLLTIIAGCVTTQTRGYTDNKHRTYVVNSIAILATSEDVGLSDAIENTLMKGLESKGLKVVKSTDIIPPTRSYTTDEIKKELLSRGFKSLLIVSVGGSYESSEVVGYQSYGHAYGNASGSAYSVGNTTYANVSGSSSGSTTTYAMNRRERNTITKTTLYDVSSTDVVWTAQTETNAGGNWFVSDGTTGQSLSTNIIEDLVSKGHIVQ